MLATLSWPANITSVLNSILIRRLFWRFDFSEKRSRYRLAAFQNVEVMYRLSKSWGICTYARDGAMRNNYRGSLKTVTGEDRGNLIYAKCMMELRRRLHVLEVDFYSRVF